VTSTAAGLKPSDISTERRLQLEQGDCESKNFMEQIAVNQSRLLINVLPSAAACAHELLAPRLTDRMSAGGRAVLQSVGVHDLTKSTSWTSDTARGWAALAVGQIENIELSDRLDLARLFAIDPHFSVREWAWLSVRPHVSSQLDLALLILQSWCEDDSPFVRRFASEVTRPRGVWSKHINELKTDPNRAIRLLDRLSCDGARYVQLSVGNWLNDASKTRPDWVELTCNRWLRFGNPATTIICNRGLRTIKKIQK
jgi:3-methyladenine DNA glycosylase AlkC